jgi:hypothetical protein
MKPIDAPRSSPASVRAQTSSDIRVFRWNLTPAVDAIVGELQADLAVLVQARADGRPEESWPKKTTGLAA